MARESSQISEVPNRRKNKTITDFERKPFNIGISRKKLLNEDTGQISDGELDDDMTLSMPMPR